MSKMDFNKAVRTLEKHAAGIDVYPSVLTAAVVAVLPSLRDINEANKAQDRYTARVFGNEQP